MIRMSILMFMIALSICVCVIMPSVRANSPPNPPCVFYGTVTVGSSPAKDGLNVTAFIAGTTLEWTTQTANGTYGWPLKGSELFYITSDDQNGTKDGGVTGDIIVFYVNGTKTDQTATFESEDAKRVDLSIAGSGVDRPAQNSADLPFFATTLGTATIIVMTVAIMMATFTAYIKLRQRRKPSNSHGKRVERAHKTHH
jgi:hypothetical protein